MNFKFINFFYDVIIRIYLKLINFISQTKMNTDKQKNPENNKEK